MSKKDLVNLVVGDMDAVLEFDDLFETPCAQFLLFVGFENRTYAVDGRLVISMHDHCHQDG